MIVVDQKSVQECNAYVAERCWPRLMLVVFGAIFAIGSFLPFIYLQDDLIIRFVFPLVWGIFATYYIFVTFVIHLWNEKEKKNAWQWVLYGTTRANGFCKLFLFVFRFATPFALYALLWIPRILQSVPTYTVDAATFALRNWLVFGIYIGLLFIGIPTCLCVDYCCKFAPIAAEAVAVDEGAVGLEQLEHKPHQHHEHHLQHLVHHEHPYMGQQHQQSHQQHQQHSHTLHQHQHMHHHQHHGPTIEYLVESESGDQVMVIEEINV